MRATASDARPATRDKRHAARLGSARRAVAKGRLARSVHGSPTAMLSPAPDPAATPARLLTAASPHGARGPLLDSASPAMRRVLRLVEGVAPTPTTVLLTGPSGAGKEVLARHLHACSPRAGRPFVAVNCGAVPEALAESTFFGHERGAFSGATRAQAGHFEAAHGGTLLLDELSELPLDLQAKLLRVLQEREVYRVGATRPRSVDVRIVATTNRDLRQLIARGAFREDLFYRVNVFPLRVPALAERREDIPALARVLAQRHAARLGWPQATLTPGALDALAARDYPGNVRELSNVIERSLVLAGDGPATAAHVRAADAAHHEGTGGPRTALRRLDAAPAGASAPRAETSQASGSLDAALTAGATLADLERLAILSVLAAHGGNRTHTARALGVSVRTLRNKLRAYRAAQIPVPAPPAAHTAHTKEQG